jgi:WD40 repeat protein
VGLTEPPDDATTSRHVFISYASEDERFVRRLHASLEQRGRDVWVAWDDIPVASPFWTDIEAAIDEADAVVFVISPDSVLSEHCRRELAYAGAGGKRLVPVECRETDPASAPSAVAALQWISFADEGDFDELVTTVSEAADRDVEWVRKHTDLHQRASTWDRNGRRNGDLARGERLAEAERLLTEGQGKEPSVTSLQTEWVLASERWRTTFRNRIRNGLVVVVLALSGVAGYALYEQHQAVGQRNEARRQRDIALMQGAASEASAESARHRDDRALLLARQAYLLEQRHPVTDDHVQRALESTLGAAHRSHLLFQEFGLSAGALGFSEHGRQLIAAGGDGVVRFWNLQGAHRLATDGVSGRAAIAVALSPDRRRVASAVGSVIEVRSVDSVAPRRRLLGSRLGAASALDFAVSLDFSPDGRYLAAAYPYDAQLVRIYSLDHPRARPVELRQQGWVNSVAFSPDGRMLAVGGGFRDGRIRLWDLRHIRRGPKVLAGHRGVVGALVFSPDAATLASGGYDGTVRLWRLRGSHRRSRVLARDVGPIGALAFSPDGRALASGGRDWLVRVWRLDSPGDRAKVYPGNDDSIVSLAFSPDGRMLASQTASNDVRLDLIAGVVPPVGARPIVYDEHTGSVSTVAFSPGGRSIVFGDSDATVHTADLQTGSIRSRTGTNAVDWLSFVDGGTLRATARTDNESNGKILVLENLRTGATTRRLTIRPQIATGLAISPDGRFVAGAGGGNRDDAVRIADLRRASPRLVELKGKVSAGIPAMAFSPDSHKLALAGLDGAVYVWDIRDLDARPTVLHMSGGNSADAVAFSRDGRFLAAGGTSGNLHVWRLEDLHAKPLDLADDALAITALAFDPRARMLAVGKGTGSIRVWNLQTSPPAVSAFVGHTQTVTALEFSPDGRLLASAGEDGIVDVRTPPAVLSDDVCRLVWRNLSLDEWSTFFPGMAYERTCPNLPRP